MTQCNSLTLTIRKLGNSAGVIIPKSLMTSLNLSVGQRLDVQVECGRLVLTPRRKVYRLDELLRQCDEHPAPPADLTGWRDAPPVGTEM